MHTVDVGGKRLPLVFCLSVCVLLGLFVGGYLCVIYVPRAGFYSVRGVFLMSHVYHNSE